MLVLSFSIFFGALAIIITYIDKEFHFQWLSLSLHFFSVATIVGYIFIHKTIGDKNFNKMKNEEEKPSGSHPKKPVVTLFYV